jgi:hypothetical protein
MAEELQQQQIRCLKDGYRAGRRIVVFHDVRPYQCAELFDGNAELTGSFMLRVKPP